MMMIFSYHTRSHNKVLIIFIFIETVKSLIRLLNHNYMDDYAGMGEENQDNQDPYVCPGYYGRGYLMPPFYHRLPCVVCFPRSV